MEIITKSDGGIVVHTLLNRLRRFDLNTLLALEALLELKHVSQAAERMNISQPAMSRLLAKLREAFDDPLLVRIHAQHQLSERAQMLQQPLRRILHDIDELLQPLSFDPADCRRTFRIALTDFSAQVFLPAVLQRIYQEAPQVKIETISLRSGMLTTEKFDHIDASICNREVYGPCDLSHHALFKTPSKVLMAKSHPLAKQTLTMDRYLAYSHVEVSLGGTDGTLVDAVLKQQGRSRNVGLRSDHVISLLPIVERTELLFTTAWELLGRGNQRYQLVSKAMPFDLPAAEYSVVWHPKNEDSAANCWLRELIIRVINADVRPRDGMV